MSAGNETCPGCLTGLIKSRYRFMARQATLRLQPAPDARGPTGEWHMSPGRYEPHNETAQQRVQAEPAQPRTASGDRRERQVARLRLPFRPEIGLQLLFLPVLQGGADER